MAGLPTPRSNVIVSARACPEDSCNKAAIRAGISHLQAIRKFISVSLRAIGAGIKLPLMTITRYWQGCSAETRGAQWRHQALHLGFLIGKRYTNPLSLAFHLVFLIRRP